MSGPALDVFIRWEKGIHVLMNTTSRFPRQLRSVLGQRIDQKGIDLLVELAEIRFLSPKEKGEALKRADQSLATLRVLLRLAFQREAIGKKQFHVVSEQLNEVGKMVGGLRRYIDSK